MNEKIELEQKFLYVNASWRKRFWSTFLDSVLVFSISFFLLWIIQLVRHKKKFDKNNILNFTQDLDVKTIFIFTIGLFIIFFIFLVIQPFFWKGQTIFSKLFGIKLVSLDNSPIKMWNLFKSYSTVIFIPILASLLYYGLLMNLEGVNKKIVDIDFTRLKAEYYSIKFLWASIIKGVFVILGTMQIHYFFTVAITKKYINWFVEFSNLIVVDNEKLILFNKKEEIETIIKPIKQNDEEQAEEDEEDLVEINEKKEMVDETITVVTEIQDNTNDSTTNINEAKDSKAE